MTTKMKHNYIYRAVAGATNDFNDIPAIFDARSPIIRFI